MHSQPSRLIILLFISNLFFACDNCKQMTTSLPQLGNWVLRPVFSGVSRSEAAVFVIGDFAYLTTGYESKNGTRLRDVWQFDPTNNSWKQMGDFAGSPRSSAVSFSIGNKGYLGTGFDGNNFLKDLWEYDPVANGWIRKADFGGTARYDAVAFGILNYGYLSCGYDSNYLKDFWKYDPTADTWKQMEPLGGLKGNPRSEAVAFVYGNKGYIVTGQNMGLAVNDFWVFDPSKPDSSCWTLLRPISNISVDYYDDGYTNIVRSNAAAFVMLGTSSGDKAYITTGQHGDLSSSTWEYDFTTDLWKETTPFEGGPRTGSLGYSVKNRGFVTTGRTSSTDFNDVREWHPNEVYNAND